jgi:hypothetical protein
MRIEDVAKLLKRYNYYFGFLSLLRCFLIMFCPYPNPLSAGERMATFSIAGEGLGIRIKMGNSGNAC